MEAKSQVDDIKSFSCKLKLLTKQNLLVSHTCIMYIVYTFKHNQ